MSNTVAITNTLARTTVASATRIWSLVRKRSRLRREASHNAKSDLAEKIDVERNPGNRQEKEKRILKRDDPALISGLAVWVW